ncbi:MAG: hypothetical protein K0R26_2233 [Bacteroidota bacterium]|jgi:hypothetical protein|nr:hypothetical protein [Bacteroidota bacterium]
MSSHHDHDHHSHEAKPVAFRTPLILALVTVLLILLAVSTCDKGHGCCEDGEKCEQSCDAKHEAHGEHGAPKEHTAVHDPEEDVVTEKAATVADSIMKTDETKTAAPAHAEEHTSH